ncbi:protein FAM177A1 [Austrofundulus limnaeus]|uniref:Protein FAM177A1 n=1 Tax=Austrofundulus limnaeus TaxID=52670 RepID=A0A2I4D2U5_AUSLI|nr:PREDICTED: protein FAM177A1-like [Austrofundulus limnaeus]
MMETENSTGEPTHFETVEIVNVDRKKVKIPRRTIHFANGDTMEEYSTDEEEEEEEQVKKEVITVDTSKLTWGPYFWFQMWRMGTSTISVCDYMGEKLASLFGITSPKYQYAIDEYYRIKKEEEEEEEEEETAQPESPPLGQEVQEATLLAGSPQTQPPSPPPSSITDLSLAVRQRRDELSIMNYDELLPEF